MLILVLARAELAISLPPLPPGRGHDGRQAREVDLPDREHPEPAPSWLRISASSRLVSVGVSWCGGTQECDGQCDADLLWLLWQRGIWVKLPPAVVLAGASAGAGGAFLRGCVTVCVRRACRGGVEPGSAQAARVPAFPWCVPL